MSRAKLVEVGDGGITPEIAADLEELALLRILAKRVEHCERHWHSEPHYLGFEINKVDEAFRKWRDFKRKQGG